MKTLLLLRHAKAENPLPGQPDIERSLTDRGKAQARALGEILKERKVTLDLVVSSPALRAKQTAELVIAAANLSVMLRFDEKIYDATPSQLLDVVRGLNFDNSSVLLVGHNPGMEQLIQVLSAGLVSLSTCTLAKIASDTRDWGEFSSAGGKLSWVLSSEI
jgi:phosphohistidine phosphatase